MNAKTVLLSVILCIICLTVVSVANPNSIRLNVPMSDGFGQPVHPDIYYNESGVFGYQYWMVITGYAAGIDNYENPELFCSHNGFDWEVPDGVTNPIAPDPDGEFSEKFNSDPDMVFVPEEMKFYIYYTENRPDTKTMLVTYDGVTVTSPINLTSVYGKGSSIATIYNNDVWYLYYVNQTDYTGLARPYMMTSTNGVNFTGSTRIDITGLPVDKEMWHMNAERMADGRINWLITAGNVNTSTNTVIFESVSDGYTDTVVTPASATVPPTAGDWDSMLVYRGCTITDSDMQGVDLYYSACTNSSIWSLLYMRLEKDNNGVWQAVSPARPVAIQVENEVKGLYPGDSQKILLKHSYPSYYVESISASITPLYTESGPYSIPTSGLVAWYKLDEGSGTTMIDSSGNGLNGTYSNVIFVDGKYNGAVSFNGVNGSALVTNFPNLTQATVFLTIRGYHDSVGGISHRTIIGTTNYVAADGWSVAGNGSLGKVAFSTNATSTMQPVGMFDISDDTNYSTICITYDSITDHRAYEYKDGKLVKRLLNVTTNMTGGNFTVGRGATAYANVTVDNIIIYDRVLSSSELAQVYYDNLQNVTLSVGGESSAAIAGLSNVVIPSANINVISRITADIPAETSINNVTVRTYQKTASPFTMSIVVGIPPTVKETIDGSFVSSWENTVSLIGVIILVSLAGSAIAVFRGKRDITDVVNDLPGIVLIVVLLVVGAIIFGQF